jgi:hypothetical protein
MADVEEYQSEGQLWLQLLHGPYEVEHCHVAKCQL